MGPLRDITIMVVDDEPDLRDLAQVMLECMGFRVVAATDGGDAFQKLFHDCPDLVLCDLTMPVMDGIEFAKKVRNTPECHHVPLVAVTSLRGDSVSASVRSAGFDAHFEKPLSFEKLEALKRFLFPPPVRLLA
jgi:CheY-like chemotaxis protein